MSYGEELLFGTVVAVVALFHLIYGWRTGKIIMEAGGPIRRFTSPVMFWLTMFVSALLLVGGLYTALIGLPDIAGRNQ